MTCPNCGAPFQPPSRLCKYCGRSLSASDQHRHARQRYTLPAVICLVVAAVLFTTIRFVAVAAPPAPDVPLTATEPSFRAAPPHFTSSAVPAAAAATPTPTWPMGNATPANPRFLQCSGLATASLIPLNRGLTIVHGQTAQSGQFGIEVTDPDGGTIKSLGPFNGPGSGDLVFQVERAGAYTVTIRSEAPSCLVAVQQPGRYEIVTAEQAAPWQLPRTFTGTFGPQKTELIPAKQGDLKLHLRHRGTGAIVITIFDVSGPWSQQVLRQPTPGEQSINVAIPADGVYLISVEMDYDRDNQWILDVTQ